LKPYVASHLKDMNRKTVYKLISSAEEISRAEISRQTGISSPTVIKIVNFFVENGFLTEAGEGESAIGRKPQILRFNPEAQYSIGVEFEGDYLKAGIVDLLGNVKVFKQIHVKPDFDMIMGNRLGDIIENIVRETGVDNKKILGVGIGIPGVVDRHRHIVEVAPLIGIFDKRDCSSVIKSFSHRTGYPVFVENDVNAAALGEFVIRRMGPTDDLIYVSLGTGLGAGIILDGRLRRGKHNFAGEMGYMVHDSRYKTSKSKPGWMEEQINLKSLSEKWSFSVALNTKSGSSGTPGEYTKDVIDHVASKLALCITNFTTLVDVDFVVIGGVVARSLGHSLLEAVQNYLSDLCLLDISCDIQQCSEPGVVGMAAIVTENRLDEILVD